MRNDLKKFLDLRTELLELKIEDDQYNIGYIEEPKLTFIDTKITKTWEGGGEYMGRCEDKEQQNYFTQINHYINEVENKVIEILELFTEGTEEGDRYLHFLNLFLDKKYKEINNITFTQEKDYCDLEDEFQGSDSDGDYADGAIIQLDEPSQLYVQIENKEYNEFLSYISFEGDYYYTCDDPRSNTNHYIILDDHLKTCEEMYQNYSTLLEMKIKHLTSK